MKRPGRSLLRLGLAILIMAAGQAQALTAGIKELTVKTKDGVKVDTLVLYPEQASDTLGVVVFNHGFMMSNAFYREVMAGVASHGFVVIAPQTMAAGGLPIGRPSTAVEAQTTASVVNWMSTRLGDLIKHDIDFDRLALLNHSRGGKVAWTLVRDGLLNAKAIAAIDPVDGTMDGTVLSTKNVQLKIPALIVGTGLGGQKKLGASCAPTDVNYNSFWATENSGPSWLFIAQDYGHMDFLDDGINCGLSCTVCASAAKGKSHGDFRSWLGDSIGAFLQGVVLGDAAALESVEDNPLNLSLTKSKR